MKYSLTFLFFLSLSTLFGQRLTGISTQWNDSFVEWTIYTEYEGEEGELRLRWTARETWREWDYRIGERSGQIRAKWPDRYDEWEVRGDNLIVSARALWRNDPREWRISGPDGRTYKWQSRYGNTFEEWVIGSEDYGFMEMYTTYLGDSRDWVIIDEIDVSLPEKLMLVFLTIFHSTPKG
jgi:hypothetical protein